MRWLFALLVLANLLVFALFQGWLSPWVRSDREPQRLADQRNPDRVRVVPLERLGGASRAEPVAPNAATLARPPSQAEVCLAFGPLDEQRANRLREALESSGARVEATRTEQAAGYLVYVPAAGTPVEVQRRLAELRQIGQTDAFVIQEGSLRMGISIGLFRSEEMARALVARLDRLGATGASIAPRGAITVSVRLQARWNDAGAADAAAIAGRYDAQARDCN